MTKLINNIYKPFILLLYNKKVLEFGYIGGYQPVQK